MLEKFRANVLKIKNSTSIDNTISERSTVTCAVLANPGEDEAVVHY